MNRKLLNVAQVILSFIIIIDVILITSTVIFDIPYDFYQKILILTSSHVSFYFLISFTDFSNQMIKSSTSGTTGLNLSLQFLLI
ncbi:hypothetical protein [Methanobrevibacter sp.]|uniref:hypothetical protein n=1 Tax=Methanobrevibacter sp. TaxID=66852 RepID=UPI00388D0B57